MFEHATKTYPQGGREVTALEDLTLTIADGEFLAVVGPSGSGKSTQLHLAEGLDLPNSGRVQVAGVATANMTDPEIVLADGPAGNLDSATGLEVLQVLRELTRDGERRRTVVMVTHDPSAAALADRTAALRDGRLEATA